MGTFFSSSTRISRFRGCAALTRYDPAGYFFPPASNSAPARRTSMPCDASTPASLSTALPSPLRASTYSFTGSLRPSSTAVT